MWYEHSYSFVSLWLLCQISFISQKRIHHGHVVARISCRTSAGYFLCTALSSYVFNSAYHNQIVTVNNDFSGLIKIRHR